MKKYNTIIKKGDLQISLAFVVLILQCGVSTFD